MIVAASSKQTASLTKPADVGQRGEEWKQRIREFHLAGKDREAKPSETPVAWLPAAAAARRDHSGFPLHYQAAGDPDFRALRDVIDEAIAAAGDEIPLLAGQAAELTQALAKAAADGAADLSQALPIALGALREELEEDDQSAFDVESRRLQTVLRRPGKLLGFEASSALYIHLRLLLDARETSRARFTAKARTLEQRLAGLMQGEAVAQDADALAESLGEAGDRFFDPDALAHSLKRSSGHKPLTGARRDRVRQAWDTLRDFLAHAARQPRVYLIHAGGRSDAPSLDGIEVLEDEDPYAEALRRFERTAVAWREAYQAVHVAELELENAYEPDRHDRAVARIDWESASVEELEAMPALVVVESAERLAERSLTSWGRLLRSGRPVQAIVTRPASLAIDELGGAVAPDFGFMAMAHREALVVEAPLAAPRELMAGLRRMSRSLRVCLAVIAVPDDGDEDGRKAAAAYAARVTPSYVYDPKLGESWAGKFSLRGNPEPEAVWPAAAWEAGAQMEAPLTPADAAALDGSWRRRFLLVPSEAWSDEQIELGEYLAAYIETAPQKVPFIWAAEASGRLGRAIVPREIASACRDVRRAWRTYQELAGVHNAYVESAVEDERKRWANDADLETARAVDQAKHEGAAEAIHRLVAALADPRGLAAATANGALAATAVPVAAPVVQAQEPAEPEPPPAGDAPSGPYIDSALCTSCNDCINLNPRMFQYNENKQAFIADAKAGPYKTLVKAAAACPAQCIHPGPPPS